MRRPVDRVLALAGVVLILAALGIIWAARSTITWSVYVSGLGADGMPTADWFRAALLCIVAGGALIAWTARDIRSAAPILRWWRPTVSIAASSLFFLVASQVPCTAGCPLPIDEDFFSLQDLVHILAAVIAFAAACWAMLQCAAAVGRPVLARISLGACVSVAVIAAAGGLMSLFGFHVAVGAWFEFVATTIGLAWIAVLGLVAAGVVGPRGRTGSRDGVTLSAERR